LFVLMFLLMSHIRLALLLCNPGQCGEPEWRLQFIRRNDPQSPTSQDRQEENVLRFWKSFQHRNGFPRLGFSRNGYAMRIMATNKENRRYCLTLPHGIISKTSQLVSRMV